MDKPLDILRKNVLRLMNEADWTQADLARALQWEPSHLNNYLRKTEPRFDKVAEIAKIFGVSPSDLFRADEVPSPDSDLTSIQRSLIAKVRALKDQDFANLILGMFHTREKALAAVGLKDRKKDKKAR